MNDSTPANAQTLVQRWHHILHARRGLHEEAADDGRNDGHGPQCQRIHHGIHRGGGHQQRAQHHGCDQRHGVGLEQVGGHAGAIAHVVTHVVGNHGGVARVVFRNARFHLAYQVGAHVGALGEDATAQARKDRDQRRAKRKADQWVEQMGQVGRGGEVAVARQKPVKARDTQKAQTHHQHAGDGPAAKRHIQRRANAAGGGLRRAHIGAHRHIHADEAAGAREHGAHHEAHGRGAVEKDTNENRQHHADDGDGLVLAGQVGGRAGLDGSGNLLHAGIAGVLGKNPSTGPEAVGHRNQSANQSQYQWGSQRCISSHSSLLEVLRCTEGNTMHRRACAALLPRAPVYGVDWPTEPIYSQTSICPPAARGLRLKSGPIPMLDAAWIAVNPLLLQTRYVPQ